MIIFRIGSSLVTYEVSEEDLRDTIQALAAYHQTKGNPESVKITLTKDGFTKVIIVDDILVALEDCF